MDNEIMELPKSWAVVKLGDFVKSEKGKKPRNESKIKTETHFFPYVDIQAFEEGIIKSWTDGVGCRLCSETDFLMVWDGSRSGLVGKGVNGALGSTLVRINFPSIVNNYAFYFLQSKYQQINTRAKGVGIPHVDPALLWNYDFSIAPLPEQHRIVAKIEALFSELDKGVESLKTAREQLKVYRQALLKHAFSGKLTEQWRAENPDKLETAEALLQRIQTEREQRYQQQLNDWETTGKQGTKPKAPKTLPPLTAEELAELPELLAGWAAVSIDTLLSLEKKPMTTGPFGTLLKKNEHKPSGIPVLGIENIGNGIFIHGNKIFVSELKAKELESFSVEANDIVISRSGTVGEICKVPNNIGKAFISTNLIRVSLNGKVINADFFVYLFQSGSIVKEQVKKLCKGSSREFLNQTILSEIVFPLPSLEEQNQIVSIIDDKLSVTDQLDQTLITALQQAETLRQSILKKAFSGQLVPQDPNDEPASELLKRIQAEKAAVLATVKPKAIKKARV